jgi:hypothetical protein
MDELSTLTAAGGTIGAILFLTEIVKRGLGLTRERAVMTAVIFGILSVALAGVAQAEAAGTPLTLAVGIKLFTDGVMYGLGCANAYRMYQNRQKEQAVGR